MFRKDHPYWWGDSYGSSFGTIYQYFRFTQCLISISQDKITRFSIRIDENSVDLTITCYGLIGNDKVRSRHTVGIWLSNQGDSLVHVFLSLQAKGICWTTKGNQSSRKGLTLHMLWIGLTVGCLSPIKAVDSICWVIGIMNEIRVIKWTTVSVG